MSFLEKIPEFFYKNFLCKPESAIPKNTQWIAMFDSIPIKAIKEITKYEPRAWKIDEAMELVTGTRDWMYERACLFFQAIQYPGESQTVNFIGTQMGGFLRTGVGGGRDDNLKLRAKIIDTNVSFATNVIRPWILATAHFGLIARDDDFAYRTNLTLFELGSTKRTERPFIRETLEFFGVCPISISEVERNYTPDTSPTAFDVDFLFNYYSVDTTTQNDFLKENAKL